MHANDTHSIPFTLISSFVLLSSIFSSHIFVSVQSNSEKCNIHSDCMLVRIMVDTIIGSPFAFFMDKTTVHISDLHCNTQLHRTELRTVSSPDGGCPTSDCTLASKFTLSLSEVGSRLSGSETIQGYLQQRYRRSQFRYWQLNHRSQRAAMLDTLKNSRHPPSQVLVHRLHSPFRIVPFHSVQERIGSLKFCQFLRCCTADFQTNDN